MRRCVSLLTSTYFFQTVITGASCSVMSRFQCVTGYECRDKSPLGQKPTYKHLTGIGLHWWTNPRGGGGGVIFFSYVGFIRRPSIYCSPPPPPPKRKKIIMIDFQAPQINIWRFSNPKNILHSVPWPSEKTRKCIEMTSKYNSIVWWPQKISTKSSNPPSPPKKKIKILNPKK